MREETVTPRTDDFPGNCVGLPLLRIAVLLCWALLACAGCGTNATVPPAITVTSLADADTPPGGTMTLRAAIREIGSGGTITFDPSLNGGTIPLGIVGSDNSPLKGEIYGGPVGMTFQGYGLRNYGKSALYAAKDLTIDASSLPDGITLTWTGGDANRARVMAVLGNLTLRNVTVTSGHSSYEAIAGTQPYTLARGGGLAVWGTATLEKCTVSGNRCTGDTDTTNSRDRGTYGGGIFANALVLTNSVVSGNAVIGYGAAGGGAYSVGGSDGPGISSSLSGCTVSGNRVTAQHAYGGGIFTLGGGPDFLMPLALANCTIARNVVEDHPGIGEPPGSQYYCRGGGVYMGGGYLSVTGCTVAENRVTGVPAIFSRKPNMGGGGIAATVGNAHVVEDISIRHSVVVGNTLNGAANDLFTGSVLNFYSHGYNRIGKIDFSQILVPIPPWWSLSRIHWPKAGDMDNVTLSGVLDSPVRHPSIPSVGTDNGDLAILWYPPAGTALDQVPVADYWVDNIVLAQYQAAPGSKDDFLFRILDTLSTGEYGSLLDNNFGANYRATFEAKYGMSLDNVVWVESPAGWPSDPLNIPWINFWRGLDNAIAGRLGSAGLGDGFWGSFANGPLGDNVTMRVQTLQAGPVRLLGSDQLGHPRPYGVKGDIGAIERTP